MHNKLNYTIVRVSADLARKETLIVTATTDCAQGDKNYNEIAYLSSHNQTVEVPVYETEIVKTPVYEKQLIDGVEAIVKVGENEESRQKEVGKQTVENENYLSPFATEAEIYEWLSKKPEFIS